MRKSEIGFGEIVIGPPPSCSIDNVSKSLVLDGVGGNRLGTQVITLPDTGRFWITSRGSNNILVCLDQSEEIHLRYFS
jgi:hypothetical protein